MNWFYGIMWSKYMVTRIRGGVNQVTVYTTIISRLLINAYGWSV